MKKDDFIGNGKVSVIVPVYQAEKYICRCVDSLINQTYKNLEIILIDDGSKDNSLKLCNELAEKDVRIRVFHHANMGVANTRNKGLDYADGEYIFFLDSDDWIDKNTLSDMVLLLEKYDADLCICGFFNYVEGKSAQAHYLDTKCKVNKNAFMSEYFWKLYEETILFNIGTKLYKRNIIEENNLRFYTDMVVYEDIIFCLKYMDKAQLFFLCNKPYYYYFQGNANSVTHSYKKNFWKNTLDYCYLLIDRFNNNSVSLKKAVLLCLYRAYLQECRNPKIRKQNFCQVLEECCFPIAEKLDLKNSNISKLSVDQKIFLKIISWKSLKVLWRLAVVIMMKNKYKGRKYVC